MTLRLVAPLDDVVVVGKEKSFDLVDDGGSKRARIDVEYALATWLVLFLSCFFVLRMDKAFSTTTKDATVAAKLYVLACFGERVQYIENLPLLLVDPNGKDARFTESFPRILQATCCKTNQSD